jgi:hypothetical protein
LPRLRRVSLVKRVERTEVGGPGEFGTMADDELKRAPLDRVKRLGFTDVGETQH